MGLATNLDLSNKPEQKTEWSFRRVFPFASAAKLLAKNFINVFDVLLSFVLLVLGVGELFGQEMSLSLYLITLPLLVAGFLERYRQDKLTTKK